MHKVLSVQTPAIFFVILCVPPMSMYSKTHMHKCSSKDFSDCKYLESLMHIVTVSSLEFYPRLETSLHELLRV